MKIVILEDNTDRQREMARFLKDRFYTFEHRFFSASQPCIDFLKRELPDTLLISLDHDLELVEVGNGVLHDPGDGRQVANFLATRGPACPVILHSTNTSAVEGMKAVLEDAGWSALVVSPFGDLEWVQAAWYPTVRQAILGTAMTRASTS